MLWPEFVALHHVFTMTTTMFFDPFFSPRSMQSAARGTIRRLAAPCLAWCMLFCTFAAGAQAPTPSPQLHLARTQLTAGMHRLDVQLAQTPEQHQIGLMWRKDMPAHEGMLFVFEHASIQCFWMRNTLIPLTAAFVEDDGTIVNLADMQPQSDDSHCSSKPVRLVLEMNQGWFAKRQIKPGYKLGGAVFSKRPD
jgi:uncharacterized membrane protein (UPF0127 family)